ncbi:hypothetical protein P879_09091 [Paragonimus westermani]|uniref:Uncharacterized protein n=1 Tax=Paragonimus westermani TaxID=34504 RepID=A0A8T0DK77_9TREM|nr:hypothetical protein P879_09091 [Paragonimus westermani]
MTNAGGTQHSGSCMHHSCSNLSVQPVRLQDQPGWYPLLVVEHCWDNSLRHLCFLPNSTRSGTILKNQGRDPYSNKSRAVDSLFIATADSHLVEYDLCVGPAESANYWEELYQDGSICLDYPPVVFRSSGEPDSSTHREIDSGGAISKSNQPPVALSKLAGDVENRKSASEKWTPEDAPSYRCNPVEITTHLSQLRRIWMGSQFTFQT